MPGSECRYIDLYLFLKSSRSLGRGVFGTPRPSPMARAGGPLGVRRALAGGMLHAGLGQNVLNCNVCKTLFENGDQCSHGAAF